MTTTNDSLLGSLYDGRYRIERRIGVGGMANVYLAEDETLGRQVAIKVLHQRYAEDSQFVERFLREATAAARLNHPNIVQVYDRGESNHTYYIAMEYVDGMTLKDLIRRRGELTEQEVLAYGRQALHALRFAHRNGIVHRDVKPHNMMVDTDGRLKIADFGIARAAADADQGLTEAGSIVGTAQYLSPEQAQGMEVGAPSDLYSLGVVMYEMAAGRVPFDGESPVNVALKHVKDPVIPPSQFVAGISPQLESIVLKAMDKDPARRYTTADEFLADLDRARGGTATMAMTQVTPITPIPAQYETPLPPEPAWPEDGDAEEEEEKRSVWRWLAPLLIVLALAGAAGYFLLTGNNEGDPVPDVVGQRLTEARTTITDAGFVVGDITTDYSEDQPEGVVLKQDPGSGDKLKAGEPIDLVISDGAEPVEVPDVVNKSRQQAIDQIVAAGFPAPTVKTEFNDEVPSGRVISQDPSAGDEVPISTKITIVVSKGEESSAVPNVVGQPVDDARKTLETAGFVVSTNQVDSARPAGTVISQSPSAGTPLTQSSNVTLTVASGSNSVPDVTGQTQSDATSALREAGFSVRVVQVDTDQQSENGLVQDTSPGAQQRVEVGSTIEVSVGRFVAAPPASP
jgi:serine/threonine-protein kinase